MYRGLLWSRHNGPTREVEAGRENGLQEAVAKLLRGLGPAMWCSGLAVVLGAVIVLDGVVVIDGRGALVASSHGALARVSVAPGVAGVGVAGSC
jgi:hypothetical protein